MTGRERFLAAINGEKPDRLPCQVHDFTQYYLKKYLNGMNSLEAYRYFDMDPVLYVWPEWQFSAKSLAEWQKKYIVLDTDADGVESWMQVITTPEGELTVKGKTDAMSSWETEPLIKCEKDFELWKKYFPVPNGCDWSKVISAKKEVGDSGIVRSFSYLYGQMGPWASFCYLMGTEQAIFTAIDEPEWTHYALDNICRKFVEGIHNSGDIPADLTETGGGAASSTVISPAMHEEFALPYDKRIHEAVHEHGCKVVYHLCGGVMPLLNIVVGNGCDALETLTPPGMGADADIEKAREILGYRVAFVGGFDQRMGFEKGNKETIEEMVDKLFRASPDGAYICSPSDHFFEGDTENVRFFAEACKKCRY